MGMGGGMLGMMPRSPQDMEQMLQLIAQMIQNNPYMLRNMMEQQKGFETTSGAKVILGSVENFSLIQFLCMSDLKGTKSSEQTICCISEQSLLVLTRSLLLAILNGWRTKKRKGTFAPLQRRIKACNNL